MHKNNRLINNKNNNITKKSLIFKKIYLNRIKLYFILYFFLSGTLNFKHISLNNLCAYRSQYQLYNYSLNNFLYKNYNKYNKVNSLKKLNLFSVNSLNIFVFFNTLTYNFKELFKYTNSLNISNYNLNYLVVYYYYFIKNVNLGINKYFTNFYQNNLYFLRFFIVKYLSSYINYKKLSLNINKSNLKIFESKLKYNLILNKLKYLRYFKGTNFKIKSILNLILISLYSKDIILLKNMITLVTERLHFKEHKKFFNTLKLILKKTKYIFFKVFKCNGLFLKVRGKLGVGGNLKKRKFIIKYGSFSFTKKRQKLLYNKSIIRTESGVLGMTLYLTYR